MNDHSSNGLFLSIRVSFGQDKTASFRADGFFLTLALIRDASPDKEAKGEQTMLTKDDIKGVAVMVPTPTKEGAEGWDVADSVDLEETARMVDNYIRAGIGVIAACGTTGECAALLWEEKRAFIDTIVQVARKRVPVFAGATALGTKEGKEGADRCGHENVLQPCQSAGRSQSRRSPNQLHAR
jgi:hypothetical protein